MNQILVLLVLIAPTPFLKPSKPKPSNEIENGNFVMIDGWIYHSVTISDSTKVRGVKDIQGIRVGWNNDDDFEGTIERDGNRFLLHIEVGWMGRKGIKILYVPVNSLIRRK